MCVPGWPLHPTLHSGPGLTFSLLSDDRTVIYLMDSLPDGENTGGFEFLVVTKAVCWALFHLVFEHHCLEWLFRKACSICYKMLLGKVILFCTSSSVREYLAQVTSRLCCECQCFTRDLAHSINTCLLRSEPALWQAFLRVFAEKGTMSILII